MFLFKGISSQDMQVVIEEEEHFIARAAQRYEITEIEGKDGAIFNELGFSYIERPILIQCLNNEKIDDILAWLNGRGDFEYKGRVTKARFYSELEPKRESCIRIINTTFIRDPFWYKSNDNYVEVSDSIENEGNVESRPVIKLIKNNSNVADITINSTRFKYNFLDNYVEINCEEKTVEYNGLNRSRQLEIGYEFPKLNLGSNSVIINSGDCDIQVKRKDRWL